MLRTVHVLSHLILTNLIRWKLLGWILSLFNHFLPIKMIISYGCTGGLIIGEWPSWESYPDAQGPKWLCPFAWLVRGRKGECKGLVFLFPCPALWLCVSWVKRGEECQGMLKTEDTPTLLTLFILMANPCPDFIQNWFLHKRKLLAHTSEKSREVVTVGTARPRSSNRCW